MGAFFTASSRGPASVGHRRAAYLAHLRAEQADLSLAVRRLRNSKPDYSPAQLDRIVASGLALADAFDLGSMQGIDLRPALAVILGPHLARQDQ